MRQAHNIREERIRRRLCSIIDPQSRGLRERYRLRCSLVRLERWLWRLEKFGKVSSIFYRGACEDINAILETL